MPDGCLAQNKQGGTMRKSLVAFVAALLVTVQAQAAPITYTAVLTGPAESPPNASPGTGFATVTVDSAAHTLFIGVNFSGLIGTTTNSHIHCCTSAAGTGTAGVATQLPTFSGFPAGVTSGSYSNTFDTTLASSFNASFITANGGTPSTAEAALFTGIAAGKAYLNIHTSQFSGGEIRGFLQPVPEPATLSLLALGLGAAEVRRRRHRQPAPRRR